MSYLTIVLTRTLEEVNTAAAVNLLTTNIQSTVEKVLKPIINISCNDVLLTNICQLLKNKNQIQCQWTRDPSLKCQLQHQIQDEIGALNVNKPLPDLYMERKKWAFQLLSQEILLSKIIISLPSLAKVAKIHAQISNTVIIDCPPCNDFEWTTIAEICSVLDNLCNYTALGLVGIENNVVKLLSNSLFYVA